ncbi:hypothetical protein KI387_039160, partial [Taxus chinensis]
MGLSVQEGTILIACAATSHFVDRSARVEAHPTVRVPQLFGLPYDDVLPSMPIVYQSVKEARGGLNDYHSWTIMTPR